MNRNVLWTLVAIGIFWLSIPAMGTEWNRNVVGVGGIIVAFANSLRYMANAWKKYQSGATEGEWRMLMGFELMWLGFGARELFLMGDRLGHWTAEGNPLTGFFAFWILCAGTLCFFAADEPIPVEPHQNLWVLGAIGVGCFLVGMIAYRMMWG